MGAVGKRRRPVVDLRSGETLQPATVIRLMRAAAGPDVVTLLREVGRIAAGRNIEAALVGGAVRDLLLGRPALEPDVMVSTAAIPLARELADRLGGTVTTHRAFGTAVVRLPGGTHLDLAGARRERYAHPGALPTVRPATFDEDALRRDFGVNTLRVDLAPGRFGRLHDPLNGLADLDVRRLRALHADSFDDDPTRAYRAVRFAARLDFRIDTETARWIAGALERGAFDRLSAQRLRREIELIFADARPARAVVLLERHGLLRPLQPALRASGQAATAVATALERLAAWPASQPSPRPASRGSLAALSVLAASLPAEALHGLIARLGPDRHGRAVLSAGGPALRLLVRRLGRTARPSRVAALLDGHPAEILAAVCGLSRVAAVRVEAFVERWRGVGADVDGRALIAAGIPEGPAVARGLRAARAVKLDRGADPAGQMRSALRAARSPSTRGT